MSAYNNGNILIAKYTITNDYSLTIKPTKIIYEKLGQNQFSIQFTRNNHDISRFMISTVLGEKILQFSGSIDDANETSMIFKGTDNLNEFEFKFCFNLGQISITDLINNQVLVTNQCTSL